MHKLNFNFKVINNEQQMTSNDGIYYINRNIPDHHLYNFDQYIKDAINKTFPVCHGLKTKTSINSILEGETRLSKKLVIPKEKRNNLLEYNINPICIVKDEIVKYNKVPTADDCVAVEVVDKSNKFLEGLFNDDADPIWWLESSSYPIKILDKKVKVLVTSSEMKKKYKED